MTLPQSLRTARWLAAAAGLSVAGCAESTWELDVTVRMQVPVLQGYDGEFPAQIVMVVDSQPPLSPQSEGGTAYRIANVCSRGGVLSTSEQSAEVEQKPLEFNTLLTGTGCGAPRYVRVWLEPREVGAESKCGSLDPPSRLQGVRKPGTGPRAEGTAFEDECGSDKHSLTLALTFKRY